jgi:uncharacterized protein YjlB
MKSLDDLTTPVQQLNIIRYRLQDDGTFPNNPALPLLIYQQCLSTADGDEIEELFESNGWTNAWKDGILDYHHYHSTAHEVLAVFKGEARLQFGGPAGPALSVSKGDVIVIPAGVAHKCIEHENDFTVVGAYPEGQQYDMMKGNAGERPAAEKRIKEVPLPYTDPVYGFDGPLIKNWKEN